MNKKITVYYRIGLLISFISLIVTAVALWIKPLTWVFGGSPVFTYVFAASFPGIHFLIVLCLQFMDLYYRKAYNKSGDEEEKVGIVAANRVGSYVVIFLSVEYLAMWIGILYKVIPAAMKLNDGDVSDFLNSLFKILAILLSVMYIFLGNYIPICRRKGQGFSCKWSDFNENTKFKSNRYAGRVFFIAGLISTAVSIIFNGYIGMGTMFVALIAALIISCKKSKEYYLVEIGDNSYEIQ